MPRQCVLCQKNKAILRRPKTGEQICKECFFEVTKSQYNILSTHPPLSQVFETEIHHTIVDNKLFRRGDNVAIAASGGKGCLYNCYLDSQLADSTVLAEIMTLLNQKYDYGLNLFLLSVDEGITGYRDDSLEVFIPI